MESIFAAIILLSFIFLYHFSASKPKNRRSNAIQSPPEAAGAWPIIGHLRRLVGDEPLYRKLADLADEYGPVYALRVGAHKMVVVSSMEAAKECYTTNDKVLASRPSNTAGKYLSYNYAIFVSSPYGNYWRQIKKIATVKLLSSAHLAQTKEIRFNEIDLHVKELYNLWVLNKQQKVKIDMKQWFEDLTFDYVMMSIAGKGYSHGKTVEERSVARRFREELNRFLHLGILPVVSDVIPWLEWLDLGGHIKNMKRSVKEMDRFISVWLEEHKEKRIKGGDQVGKKDFMDVMLSVLEESGSVGDYDPDTVAKAVCLTMLMAGIDTTSVTLTWALALVMQNPNVLSKAKEELDNKIGPHKVVQESDIPNLPYLQSIIKETLRLCPAAPIGAPHYAMEDCRIKGFHVPAGSWVFFNLWKIHRDPRVWPEPEKFWPERFLSPDCSQLDVRGNHFELIPFGSGRRACPGISFALQVLHLTLGRIIHEFEMEIDNDEELDMSDTNSIIMRKNGPLNILMSPRSLSKCL